MRRLLTVALLYVGLHLLLPLGAEGYGGRELLTFGFLVLAASSVGEAARAVGLPSIVGYLAAGAVFGPSLLGPVSAEGVVRLAPVSELAIAFIAFLAGAELRVEEMRGRGATLLRIATVEVALTFVLLTAALYLVAPHLPPLRAASAPEHLAFALLFASIAAVHSPAVTMAVLTETGARGPVARTTLGVVLIVDVVVVLLFAGALAAARALAPPEGVAGASLGLVVWEITGALAVGALLGAAVAFYLRFVGRELILFAVLVAFFGVEIARLAHVELLLTLLTAGFVAENLAREDGELRRAVERSAAPVFVVFFALAGAKTDVAALGGLLPLVVPLAALRAAGIWGGTRLGLAWSREPRGPTTRVWQGLVSQAGVAIGLATIVAGAYGERGAYLQTLLLAFIVVNETVGAVLFRDALARSGEIEEEGGDAA